MTRSLKLALELDNTGIYREADLQRVPIIMVRPGMILAKPVNNEKGMTLCAVGTELTANIIEKLKKMDVRVVTLKGHPVDMGIQEITPEEKISKIEDKFSVFKDNAIMDRLKEAIEKAVLAEDTEEDEEQGIITPDDKEEPFNE